MKRKLNIQKELYSVYSLLSGIKEIFVEIEDNRELSDLEIDYHKNKIEEYCENIKNRTNQMFSEK